LGSFKKYLQNNVDNKKNVINIPTINHKMDYKSLKH